MKNKRKFFKSIHLILVTFIPFLLFGQEQNPLTDVVESPLWNLGLFFGICLFSLITALILYLVSKDKAYLFYSLFVFSNFLYFLHYYEYYGDVAVIFNFMFEELSANLRIAFLLSGYIFYYYFAIWFLNLKQKNPKVTLGLKRCAAAVFCLLVVHTLFYQLGWSAENEPFSKYKKLHDFTIGGAALVGIYGFYLVYKLDSILSKILVAGAALFFVGSFAGFLLTASTDYVSPLLQNYPLLPTQIGFLCEILFFSIGLAYRNTLLEEAKEKAVKQNIQQLQENQKLELSKKDAMKYKELHDFKTKFYTNITHELRTPLTVILGMTSEIEKNQELNLQSRLSTIHRNGNQLLDLVERLLELNKYEEGGIQPKYVQGKIILFLRELTEAFQFYASSQQRNLSFFTKIEDSFLMDFDAEKLQRILGNLIFNAIKFTPKSGEIEVIVTKDEDEKKLSITVADTGKGISSEALPYVFDRFYQADNSDTRRVQGTGIGLALVREMTELLDGEISVKSVIGQGTTFELTFPISQNAPLEPLKAVVPDPKIFNPSDAYTSNGKALLQNEKPIILLIEDNQEVANFMGETMGEEYQFIFASNGEIGTQVAFDNIPDLIISDVMMPKMDGFEACRILKNDARTNHIPIVLLTAKTASADRMRGLSNGADAYLEKPFDREVLTKKIEDLLRSRKNILEENEGGNKKKIEDEFLRKLNQAILENIEEEGFDVEKICKAMNLGRTQIYRKVKALTKLPITLYARVIRLQEAKRLLELETFNISEVAYKVGYKHPANFSTLFKKQFGVSPRDLFK